MFLMFTTAHATIRNQKFELFWYTHQICALIFLLSLFTHATGCFVRDSPLPDFTTSFPFYSTNHCLGYERLLALILVPLIITLKYSTKLEIYYSEF